MRIKTIFYLLGLLIGRPLFGNDLVLSAVERRSCDFQIQCALNGKQVAKLDFRSSSGICSEDDMKVTNLTVPPLVFNMPRAWYSQVDHISEWVSVCAAKTANSEKPTDVSAFAVDDKKILIFLTKNDRPSYDQVVTILLDAESGQLLDFRNLGATKSAVAVVRSGKNHKVRIVREVLKNINCDCSARHIDEWLEVAVKGNRIHANWAPDHCDVVTDRD